MIDEDDAGSDVNLDFDFSMLQINDFPNVKIKVDSLFYDWLLSSLGDGGQSLLAELRQTASLYRENKSTYSLTDSVLSSSSQGSISPSAQSDISSESNNPSTVLPAASIYFAPPLSPNRKSPKKRLQSEMMLKINNETATAENNNYDNHGNVMMTPLPLSQLSSENKDSDEEEVISTATSRRRSNFDTIPVFYVPGELNKRKSLGVREEDSLLAKLSEIEAFFKPFKDGIPVDKFVHVTKRLCNFPSYFNVPFCERIFELFGHDTGSGTNSMNNSARSGFSLNSMTSNHKVTLKIFLQYWKQEMEPYDAHERFFRLLKQPEESYIHQDDFLPYLHELLRFHPGLDFLDGHEEFQRKYALTVITRIFFKVNTARSGKLSLREVRRSKLLLDFIHVDEETEINRVKEYFAYEHFYVLYCRFFELDLDKDSKLSRDDLIKYGDHSLSEAIVDRIFQVGQRAFSDGKEGFDQVGGMTYPDFIYFMLAEEDKANEQSIRYWFRCCDLDGDGVITPAEMGHFYKTQIHRLTSLGQETIQFRDVLCQMLDMLNPKDATAITLKDFTSPDKRKAGGIIFDVLFNLNKFLRFEMRDPFQEKLRREDGFTCEWDRFAHFEYHRLAAEDDVNSNQQQYNSYNQNNINVVINEQDVDNDDYNMFSEDDNDAALIVNSANHGNSNMMDVDHSLDVSNRGTRNTHSHNKAKDVNPSSEFGDWSLDDESDSDDDYQNTSNGKYDEVGRQRSSAQGSKYSVSKQQSSSNTGSYGNKARK